MNARRLGFAAIVLLVSVVLMQPASATYRWSSLVYSPDGRHWSPEISGSPFGDDIVLVPGDSEERSFLLGNRGGEPVHVDITVRPTDRSARWADTFRVELRAGAGPWRTLQPDEGSLDAELDLADDAEVAITLRASMPAASADQTSGRRLHLDVELTPTERTRRTT
ncbi:hypothetical protein GON03_02000 [Nocardioides sp. MAH-18]|uniref:Uncharacterized protein n=1 Tax=Nocardioides agri TaxID=2682843 RepID=A0A6L6XLZ9_9ACTN|nr:MULTISPECIES: hypothetical protein [unclassified Nocardioides]MBA2953068.1 hypothetical protein [Nocardioides sp. CGMCC 1.13656]MVQ47938.1 hypothetical protein [Nocardioides sp. MAH-18]